MTERELLENNNLLKRSENPIYKRLVYNSIILNGAPLINKHNAIARDKLAKLIINKHDLTRPLEDALTTQQKDILLSEVDRYGLPLRTVINLNTGLIRSDPYYNENFLLEFYTKHYRSLYSNNLAYLSIFKEQISRGETYLNYCKEELDKNDKILEIGCGMGGILLPFKLNGFNIKGIDLGEEYVELGNKFNLNLSNDSIDELINKGETYDFIILSHLIEHIPDINTFLKKVSTLLSTNGKAFIAVPGIKMIHKTYQSDISIYLQNAHCWSFSENTLKSLLISNGFKIIKSDENINCLAIKSSVKTDSLDLGEEAQHILEYLTKTEKEFNFKNKIEKSLLKKIFRTIKNGIKQFYTT